MGRIERISDGRITRIELDKGNEEERRLIKLIKPFCSTLPSPHESRG